MFCPHCASKNDFDQNFCRSCGLKLEAISRNVAEQFPSVEYAALQKRKEFIERLGIGSLSIAALIAISFVFSKIIEYKLVIVGAEIMYWSAFIAFIVFGLLSVFLFNYPKLFMKFDELNPRLSTPINDIQDKASTTNKLIEDRPFEPASVTEDTTRSLKTEEKVLR